MTRSCPVHLRLLLALLSAGAAVAAASSATPVLHRAPLATWRFRSLNGSIALANVSTPGTSHTHLMAGGVLTEDPYARFNERDMQWVATTTWVYETSLPAAVVTAEEGDARVVFETLDGVAHVALNGQSLGLPAVNAFHPHAFAVPRHLLHTNATENTLQVVFTPPLEYMQQRAAAYPYDVPATRNFNVWAEPSHRPFLRKAGSDFGWDWGPAYVTSGMAGDAFVEWLAPPPVASDADSAQVQVAQLTDLDVAYAFAAPDDFSTVRGNVTFDVESVPTLDRVTLRLFVNGTRHGNDMVLTLHTTADRDAGKLTASTPAALPFELAHPTLWWPAGSGDPHLYDVRVDAYGSVADGAGEPLLLATLSHRVGFRSVELVQEPTRAGGTEGATFFFRINNVPIFMKGANWIPTDAFPTRVPHDDVTFLLTSARASHMNMVRVWGGGRYESDFFYATCDRLGLLVWHEFMFACAMYPRDRAFLADVALEVTYQTRRLRKFTSVAIWGGNNENENMMSSFSADDPVSFSRDVAVVDFTKLFVDTLRPLVLSLDTSRPFVDTSPSNGLLSVEPYVKRWGPNTNDVAFGDVHYYNYAGDCQDPTLYPRARFVSEFGFQSAPSLRGLQAVSAPEDWRSFQAFWTLLKFRERHANGTQEMAAQLQRRFHVPFPFLDEAWLETPLQTPVALDVEARVGAYLYLTQIQQSLCYQTAIETWRRGRNEHVDNGAGTMGILYWQLNDVWQGTSWSSMEFDGRWKSLQYAVKRAYAPVLLSAVIDGDEVVVVGLNDLTDRDVELELVYETVTTDSGHVQRTTRATKAPMLPRLSSETLDRVAIGTLLDGCDTTHCFVRLRCRVVGENKKSDDPCADAVDVFLAPFKTLALRHGRVAIDSVTAVTTTETDAMAFDVTLRTDGFVALFVEVDVPHVRGFWNKNSFHLVGNATETLRFEAAPASGPLLTAERFAEQLELRWLQQTYETEATVAMA